MNRMPQTEEEWRDYEADRLMARALESRKELEKTHSFTKLVEMQREWDKRVAEENNTGVRHD